VNRCGDSVESTVLALFAHGKAAGIKIREIAISYSDYERLVVSELQSRTEFSRGARSLYLTVGEGVHADRIEVYPVIDWGDT
jgi:hypothetical protein